MSLDYEIELEDTALNMIRDKYLDGRPSYYKDITTSSYDAILIRVQACISNLNNDINYYTELIEKHQKNTKGSQATSDKIIDGLKIQLVKFLDNLDLIKDIHHEYKTNRDIELCKARDLRNIRDKFIVDGNEDAMRNAIASRVAYYNKIQYKYRPVPFDMGT